jgi:hypothetical protein
MLNEPYTLLDAMREEIDTLTEMETICEKQKKLLLASSYRNQKRSLQRIVNRFEKGHEYYMGIDKEGDPQLKYRQGTRHLEREYPSVAKAKRNLDIVTDLVKGDK